MAWLLTFSFLPKMLMLHHTINPEKYPDPFLKIGYLSTFSGKSTTKSAVKYRHLPKICIAF